MPDEYIKILLSSTIPILLTIFVSWIGHRDAKSKRKQMYENARERIELINAYIASQKLVMDEGPELNSVRRKARFELYRIQAFLDNNTRSLEEDTEKSKHYWRDLFLWYPMQTKRAKFFRACFYGMLIFSTFSIFSALFALFLVPSVAKEYQASVGVAIGTMLIELLCYCLPFTLAALFFRKLAIKNDQPTNLSQKAELAQQIGA